MTSFKSFATVCNSAILSWTSWISVEIFATAVMSVLILYKAEISVFNPAKVEILLVGDIWPATVLMSVLIVFRFVISVPKAPSVEIWELNPPSVEILFVGEICPATKFIFAEFVSTLVTFVLIL